MKVILNMTRVHTVSVPPSFQYKRSVHDEEPKMKRPDSQHTYFYRWLDTLHEKLKIQNKITC